MSSNENTMAKIKESLTNALAAEKQRLCLAIGKRLVDDDARTTTELGSLGHLPGLPGTLYVNCYKNGKPCPDLMDKYSVGNGRNSLSHYFWIPAIYRDGDVELRYLLSLCREDLDVDSGNLHADFSRLQLQRLTHDGFLIGGQTSSAPERIARGWRISYLADESFPRAARCCGGRTVDADDRPWGYEGFEGTIPTLDMTDSAYDSEAVAEFFLALIVRDCRTIKEHLREEREGKRYMTISAAERVANLVDRLHEVWRELDAAADELGGEVGKWLRLGAEDVGRAEDNVDSAKEACAELFETHSKGACANGGQNID